MTNHVTVRRGVNFTRYFDSYNPDGSRITYTGWRFVLKLCGVTYATDDASPRLTVVDATEAPTGKRLAFHLSATETAALGSGGTLSLLRIDPADPTNVEEIAGPVSVNLAPAP